MFSKKSNCSGCQISQTKVAELHEKVLIWERRNATLEDQLRHQTAELSKIRPPQATLVSRVAAFELGNRKLAVSAPPTPFDSIGFIHSLRKNPEDYEDIRPMHPGFFLRRERSSGRDFTVTLYETYDNIMFGARFHHFIDSQSSPGAWSGRIL
jgi:hypothetical protein